jgi:hypothetical protein
MTFLKDGYQTLYTFSVNPSVYFKERSVTPPGLDGGDEVDTTTMRNTRWRTRQPRALITLTESNTTVSYDPAIYDDILDLINVNQLITITFPDGSTLAFWGWLRTFTPGENAEGEFPSATVNITPSNQDDSGNEVDPVFTPAP